MREILFRGKTVDSGRWIFGDLSNYGDSYTGITTTKGFSIIDSAEVTPETVGQYTGMTDKNGTKIFEGDIICREFHGDYYTGVVYFTDDFYGYSVTFIDGTTPEIMPLSEFHKTRYIEVIGNIHDNPELLKGE